MKKKVALLAIGLISIAACQPAATTREAAGASASSTAFAVNALSEADVQIQGCTRMLNRTGGREMIFAEDAVDAGAKGFIRIDGQLINVGLTAASGDEHHSTRNFADADHTLSVVESLTTGAAHEQSDSVEEAGTLAVTYKGATQTMPVEGGTAC